MNQSSHFPSLQINTTSSSSSKRKRRPAGTPDPDAEVVSLSPRTLLESDRYVCEICNQGFQRDQNLQMHRRRHKVPWKLVKREGPASQIKKRVFVCPEPSCLHHDPGHALGDLVGIKKHFRRKHSDQRQWVCERCNKGYAVQSDYKAHLKTCGTRGHSCDCGRVFSRVESFIEHQDKCNTSNTTSPSPSSDLIPSPKMPHNLELQLLPTSITSHSIETEPSSSQPDDEIRLQLSIGCNTTIQIQKANKDHLTPVEQHAKRQVEIAEQELENAKRMRQKALLELNKAYAIRDQAIRQINATLLQITCCACKQKFQSKPTIGINLDNDQNKLMNEELG